MTPVLAVSPKTAAWSLLVLLLGAVLSGGLRSPGQWGLVAAAFWLLAACTPPPAQASASRWGLLLAWMSLSALFSGQPLPALAPLSRWTAAAAFLTLSASLWGERERRAWALGVMGLGAAACAAALLSVRGLSSYLNARDVQELTVGLFPPYYNYTAFVALAGAAASAAWLFSPEGRRGWPAALAAACLGLCGVFAVRTSPRAAVLAFGVALALTLVRRRRLGMLLLCAAIAAGGVLALKGPILARLLKRDRDSVAKRPQIWAAALRAAADAPLLGAGPGNFELGFRRHNFASHYRVTNYQFTTPYAHSELLQTTAETGFVGLMLLLWALAACASWPRPGPPHQEAALSAAAAMSVQLLADNMLHVPAFLLLYLSAWAALTPAREGPAVRFWRPACILGALLAIGSWAADARLDRLVRDAEGAGHPARRLEAAQAWTHALPLESDAWESLARAELTRTPSRPLSAREAFAKAGRLSPKNAVYPLMEMELARALGDRQGAEALARRALKLEPNCLAARMTLAEEALRSGDRAAAREALEETRRRMEALREAKVYTGNRTLYTGYDFTVTRFDEKRFRALEEKARR